jgi:ADP-ribose pyrophosphatase
LTEDGLVDADRAAAVPAHKPGQIESRPVHDGPVVNLAVDTVRFPDGSTGELELVRHSGASAVVPLLGDPASRDPDIVLLRQHRYAAGGELFEIPAGRPDHPGEAWEDVARRELEEETGYRPAALQRLTTIYTTPGFTDERIHLFLATGLEPGASRLDEDEFVEVVIMKLSEVLAAIQGRRIIDAKSLSALLYFAAFAR